MSERVQKEWGFVCSRWLHLHSVKHSILRDDKHRYVYCGTSNCLREANCFHLMCILRLHRKHLLNYLTKIRQTFVPTTWRSSPGACRLNRYWQSHLGSNSRSPAYVNLTYDHNCNSMEKRFIDHLHGFMLWRLFYWRTTFLQSSRGKHWSNGGMQSQCLVPRMDAMRML